MRSESVSVFIICINFFVSSTIGIKVACRDENGNTIDWFYLYKLPSHFRESYGLRYLYLTSNSYQEGWKLSNISIDNTNSFPGKTLSSIFQDPNILSIAYNDEVPNGPTNNADGHTKGVVAADSLSGFWLIHSVPKYPSNQTYNYPESGTRYGQSFLCITFNSSQMNQIGGQLIYNEPNVYHSVIPNYLKNLYPNFVDVSDKKWKKDAPYWNQEALVSLENTHFLSFAKGRQFKKELYEDWVAPILNVDLLVETWRNGGGNFPSNCSRSKHVLNIVQIEIDDINLSFKSTDDHSKWGVANVSDNWICVGDINRQEHQLKRGGGTVCQLNPKVAENYRKLVKNYEPCSTHFL